MKIPKWFCSTIAIGDTPFNNATGGEGGTPTVLYVCQSTLDIFPQNIELNVIQQEITLDGD